MIAEVDPTLSVRECVPATSPAWRARGFTEKCYLVDAEGQVWGVMHNPDTGEVCDLHESGESGDVGASAERYESRKLSRAEAQRLEPDPETFKEDHDARPASKFDVWIDNQGNLWICRKPGGPAPDGSVGEPAGPGSRFAITY